MTEKAVSFHQFRKAPIHLAVFALFFFQVICLGVAGIDHQSKGKVISQKTRKCSLAIAGERPKMGASFLNEQSAGAGQGNQ